MGDNITVGSNAADITPADTAASNQVSLDKADRSAWEQLTDSIRAGIVKDHDNGELRYPESLDDTLYRHHMNRRQKIAIEPIAGLILSALAVGALSLANVDHSRIGHSAWMTVYIVAAAAIAATACVIQTRLRRQVTIELCRTSQDLGLRADSAIAEISSAVKRGQDGAADMLAAAEDMMPGFEELLLELTALTKAYNRSSRDRAITGDYLQALRPRITQVQSELLTVTAELLAAARISFASRPNLLATVNAPAALIVNAPVTVVTDAAQQSLAEARTRLVNAATAVADS